MYPNPANNTVKIQFTSKIFGLTTVSIIDILGKTLREYTISHPDGPVEKDLNITGLAAGSYYVRFFNPEIHYTKSLKIY